MERAPVAQRLSKSDSYQPKPVGPTSDYRQHSEQPAAQRSEMASPVRDPAMNTPPQSVSSQLSTATSPAAASTSVSKASTPPRVSAASAVSESPTSAPRPPTVSSPDVESTPPQISTPPNVPSAPLMMQGLRPPTSAATEISPAGSKHLSAGSSSSSLPASPPKLSTPLTSTDGVSRPAAVSSVPSSSAAHQTKSSLPPTTVSPPALVSTSSYSVSAPISSLQQMVQGSKSPLMTSCFPDASGAQHERPGPPKLVSTTSSVGAKSSSAGVAPPLISESGPSTSTPPVSCLSTTPSVGSKPSDPAPAPQRQTYTPPAADSGLSTASAASLPPGAVNLPSLAAHESPTVRPLSTLPLLTTQASRTAPVSAPPALVSVPPAMGTSSGVVQSSDSEQRPPNTTPPHALKQSSPKPEHHGHSQDRKALAYKRNRRPEERPSQLDSGIMKTSEKVEATESNKSEIRSPKTLTDLPGNPLQATVAPDQKPKNKQTDSEKHHMQSNVICEAEDSMLEQTPVRTSSHLHSTRLEHPTDNESFDNSSHTASQLEGNSTFDTPSRVDVSSVFEKTSLVDGDSSCVDDSSHFDSSFHLRKNTSRFDSTSHAEEEPSGAFDTTRDSSSSVEDSRNDTLDSTRETSDAEETKDSCQITGESMLESSLNNTSQMEEPSFDSSDVSNSRSFVPSQTGTFL